MGSIGVGPWAAPLGGSGMKHPHRSGPHRISGETAGQAGGKVGCPAGRSNRVTIARALVRGRVPRRIRSDRRGPARLLRRRGADVHGAHPRRSARQGSAARHHELTRSCAEESALPWPKIAALTSEPISDHRVWMGPRRRLDEGALGRVLGLVSSTGRSGEIPSSREVREGRVELPRPVGPASAPRDLETSGIACA